MDIKSKFKSKVNVDDILFVLYWVNSFAQFESKPFSYQHMLEQAETYKYNNTKFDTSIHPIDDLMIDAYKIYSKLTKLLEQFSNVLDVVNIPFVRKEVVLDEVKKFTNIFEDLIENYHYDDPEIRGIQKGFLTEKMKKYITAEEYEQAARLRDIIKES